MLRCNDACWPNDVALAVGEAAVVYIVQAVVMDRGAGTYKGQLETRQAAIERADELRLHGMKAVVIGPDGKPIEETNTGSLGADVADHRACMRLRESGKPIGTGDDQMVFEHH
jgi:hypothetical protein